MKRALLLVTLFCAAVVLLLFAREDSDAERALERARIVEGAPAASGAPPPLPDTRAEVASDPAREPVAVAAADERAVLRGRCVDEDGSPLAGCRVSLQGWGRNGEDIEAYRLAHGELVWEDPPALETAADGLFELRFVPPPPYQFSLDIRCAKLVGVEGRWSGIEPGARMEFGDVVLLAGGRVEGIVVDTDGVPQPTLHVSVGRERTTPPVHLDGEASLAPSSGHTTRTGAGGRFAFREPIQLGSWRAQVDGRQLQAPATFNLTAQRPELELRLEVLRPEDLDAIEGVVVDEAGAPLNRVHISPEAGRQGGGRMCTTDREGRFRLERRGQTGDDPHRLRLSKQGYETLVTEEAFEWGARELRLVMQRGLGVHLHVVDRESGEPVLEYGVRLFPKFESTNRRSSRDYELRAFGLHEDGWLVIDGVERGPYELLVETPDDAWVHPLFVEFEVLSGPTIVPVAVEAPTWRRLRVESGGLPMAGTTVELLRPFDGGPVAVDHRAREMDQLMGYSESSPLIVQRATTDAQGEALLAAHGSSAYALRLSGGDHQPRVLQGVRLDQFPDPWVIDVQAGATLVGRVTPLALIGELRERAGLSAQGRVVESERYRLPGVRLSGGEHPNRRTHPGRSQRVALDPDGGFEISGIPPGSWRVELSSTRAHGGGRSTQSEPVAEVRDLRAGEQRELEIDLSRWLRGSLRGRVWLDGEPYAGQLSFMARLAPDPSGRRQSVQEAVEVDAEGQYTARLRAGRYWPVAHVQLPESGRWLRPFADEPVSVVSGEERQLDLNLRTGHVRLRLVREDGSPIEGMTVQLAHELDVFPSTSPPSDAEGRMSMQVPFGALRVRVTPKRLLEPEAFRRFFEENQADPDAWSRAMVELGEVQAGSDPEPDEVELRVPDAAGY